MPPRLAALPTKPPLTSPGHPPLSFQTAERLSLAPRKAGHPSRGSKQPGQAEGTPAHTHRRLAEVLTKPESPATRAPDHVWLHPLPALAPCPESPVFGVLSVHTAKVPTSSVDRGSGVTSFRPRSGGKSCSLRSFPR